ncbi:MAG: phage tail tube protein, partial [Polyangiaceae bacterium]
ASAATVVSETGLPFFFASGTFTVDGVVVASLEKFKLILKNTIDKPQAGAVTVFDLIWGRRTLDVEYSLIFANDDLYRKFFYGGATGTTDSAVLGNGSLDLLMLQGGLVGAANTLDLQVPSIDYYGDEPTAKLAGNAMVYDVKGYATHGGSPLITAVVKNSQATAYP